jgi:hypothetical protein
MIMGISRVELNYWNFQDERATAIMYCIEDVDDRGDGFERTFICFEEEYNINKNILELIEKNRKEIHAAIGNMDKIEKLIESENIRYTASTTKWWDDVRLFPHTSRFSYAEDVYNLAALEVEINKHIKNKFYNKDKIIDACESGDMNKALELLYKGKFTEDEMTIAFEISPRIREVFGKYNLHNVLAEVLPVNDVNKPKPNKM